MKERRIQPARQRSLLAVPLVYLVFYTIYFSVLEELVRPRYWISCPLDDLIPFCELFVVPYLLWFLLVPGMYYWFYRSGDTASYLHLCRVMLTGLTLCLLIYTFFPNGQLLRRPIPRDNIFCGLVRLIRGVDTSTNVCPSIHVFVSTAVAMVAGRAASLRDHPVARRGIQVLVVLICLSAVFLKQHSVVDVILGAALAFLLDALALRGWLTVRAHPLLLRKRKSMES